ncbi:MAG: endolytic transglycosylase MltG [Actinobacteria bacterium]|nr:endolytic transglycosylase MltG [Actinomycetota bacterium]
MRRLIVALLSGVLITGSAISIHNAYLLNDYLTSTSASKAEILIEDGDTGVKISQKLYDAGVIKAAKVFYKIALNQKRANSISPGIHEIDLKISAQAALEQLLDPARNRGVFRFNEGLRKIEILDLLVKSKLVVGQLSPTIKPADIFKTNNLEGFLFPANYSFAPATTTDQAIMQMLERFNLAAKTSKIDKGYGKFSPFDLVTIASIVQAEGDVQDFTKIAQVIYNRLKIGMPLQMNTTIEYAANLRGKIRLPYKQLEINSRYNTYKYQGLPPGPIGNPGQAALEAAVNPQIGDWLYFITVKPQETRFTKSITEFNIWADEFRKNEKAGLFK